jgi:glutamine amidotransferase
MSKEIAVIDYGMCNMLSILRGIEKVGAKPVVVSDYKLVKNFPFIILPGVGSFPDGMNELMKRGFIDELKEVEKRSQKILGICLGMQMLFSFSEEIKYTEGLNLIEGSVKKLPAHHGFKVPNVNWHQIVFKDKIGSQFLSQNLMDPTYMYFVHSYFVSPENTDHILTETTLNDFTFTSSVKKNNIMGTQFHPEKSGENGLKLLQNFIFDDK